MADATRQDALRAPSTRFANAPLVLLCFVPAYRLSLVSFAIPVVAPLVGAAFGGEPLGPRTLVGTAMVLGGLLGASR